MIDHALQSHGTPIVGGIDARDAIVLEKLNFFWQDGSSTSTKDFDMGSSLFLKQVMYVFKKLNMPPLVGSNRNGLHILLNRTVYNFLRRAVVSQVNHLHSCGLDDAPHDVDRSIVPIK